VLILGWIVKKKVNESSSWTNLSLRKWVFVENYLVEGSGLFYNGFLFYTLFLMNEGMNGISWAGVWLGFGLGG
jgi:hypothetical protein